VVCDFAGNVRFVVFVKKANGRYFGQILPEGLGKRLGPMRVVSLNRAGRLTETGTMKWNLLAVLLAMTVLEILMLTSHWGVLALDFYILVLFVFFRPPRIFHPNTFVFGYYFLWLLLPSVIDFIFEMIDWTFVLPWGRLWFWGDISAGALFQVQLTATTLITVMHFATRGQVSSIFNKGKHFQRSSLIQIASITPLHILSIGLACLFIFFSGGLDAWLTDYSYTFLTGRKGLGVMNFTLQTVGSLTIYLAGLKSFNDGKGWWGILPFFPTIMLLSFVGGMKSRFIILLILFYVPYLIKVQASVPRLVRYMIVFLAVFYILSLVRTGGFYSGLPRYSEMMLVYFNAIPLHDFLVGMREPGFFETVHHIFVKPGQALGLIDPGADYDISVMLTKEFFPEQWYDLSATQQWPLETDMYINFYGGAFQIIPLLIYAVAIGFLYRRAVLVGSFVLLPIAVLEMIRIVSTLRGTLIPWALPVMIVQYSFMLIMIRLLVTSKFKKYSSIDPNHDKQ